MANWLLDYIEMTEYIPVEFRDQSFLMRELDLKVSNKMSQLEEEIKDFFSKIDKLGPQERQDQYDALLKKCDEASQAASDKIKLADRLHDLVEKSMRLLDQGLEKLKEDLIEGDKGYIVEDIERRSQELDQQLRAEEEGKLQRQQQHSKMIRDSKTTHSKNTAMNHLNDNNHSHHRHSLPANRHNNHHHNTSANNSHYRSRNNSTGTQHTVTGQRPRKRERKRLNSTMTIFNRNSATRTDDDSTNQTFLSSPSTPDYLVGLHNSNSNSLNEVSGGDNSSLILKGMISGNRNSISGVSDNVNGNDPILVKARQPILTAIDAAHAVSPNATNSDKLNLFSGHANGDNYKNSTHNKLNIATNNTQSNFNRNHYLQSTIKSHNQTTSQYNNHSMSQNIDYNLGQTISGGAVGANDQQGGSGAITKLGLDKRTNSFASLPLSSRHDPIYMAATQAINATQSMTSGRRTSSLKASYAAVNSGRVRPDSNHSIFDQSALTEVYCKCRGTKHDPNMIACDNKNCKIEWFHYECVGITTPPDGEWYCDDCKASMGYKATNNHKHLKRIHDISAIAQTSATLAQTTTVTSPKGTTDTTTSTV